MVDLKVLNSGWNAETGAEAEVGTINPHQRVIGSGRVSKEEMPNSGMEEMLTEAKSRAFADANSKLGK